MSGIVRNTPSLCNIIKSGGFEPSKFQQHFNTLIISQHNCLGKWFLQRFFATHSSVCKPSLSLSKLKNRYSCFSKRPFCIDSLVSTTSPLSFSVLKHQYLHFGEKCLQQPNVTRKTFFCTASLEASSQPHIPVLLEEVVEFLEPEGKKIYLDMTFGAGGHSKNILESSPNVRLLCLDRDPTAYKYAKKLHEEYPDRVIPLLGKFSDIPRLFQRLEIGKDSIDGVLIDHGTSSMQFDTPERGFMISKNGPLDMRMDANRIPGEPTASDVLMHLNEEQLYKVLKYYGEEKNARTIARALVESRYLFQRLRTTSELAEFVKSLSDGEFRLDKLGRRAHPATKTFQAIRILVNNELGELDYALRLAHYYLRPKGVLVAISFHSLEDTIIKNHIKGIDLDQDHTTTGGGLRKHRSTMSVYSSEEMESLMEKRWIPLNKHVVLPSENEVKFNPRCRSAKLRAARKLH